MRGREPTAHRRGLRERADRAQRIREEVVFQVDVKGLSTQEVAARMKKPCAYIAGQYCFAKLKEARA